MDTHITTPIEGHLKTLAERIGARPTGSQGNQQAGAYLQEQFQSAGWAVETQAFDCLTWQGSEVKLTCGGQAFCAQVNPYSPSFAGQGLLTVCTTAADLESNLQGRVVVLTGELATYPYMPKKFPFLTLDDQQHILHQLETAQPAALIGVHPSPLFCDADFHLPSVTLAPEDEARLLTCVGKATELAFTSRIIPSSGYNVLARQGTGKKVVICAHYDTWFDTPGALDNAAGVTVLLMLAEALKQPAQTVEMVAFNGEDHYAAPGQVLYLAGGVADIEYVINIDGIGAVGKRNSLALFGDAPALFDRVRRLKAAFPNIVEGELWYQGDHSIFVQQGIPALAFTCDQPFDLTFLHTPADTVDQVNPAQVGEVVAFIKTLLEG